MDKQTAFKIDFNDYIGSFIHHDALNDVLKEGNTSMEELREKNVKYTIITMENEQKKAFLSFEDEKGTKLVESFEDDWYAIMDVIFDNKWRGIYKLLPL